MDVNGQTAEMVATHPQQGTGAWMVTASWPLGFENLADARITLTRQGLIGGHILTLENARDLARVVAKVERETQTAFENAHNPYLKTWKHKGVFGPAEVHVGPRGMVGLNGVMHFGLSVRLDEEFSGAGLIDLDTARWLVDKLQRGIALVEAAQVKDDR